VRFERLERGRCPARGGILAADLHPQFGPIVKQIIDGWQTEARRHASASREAIERNRTPATRKSWLIP
jgi:hypothetical protein